MEIHKNCVFLGHRTVDCNNNLREKIKEIVETLIVNNGVTNFLFGSRSDFVSLFLFINFLVCRFY